MLVELLVENFAVVEQLRVRFHPGLNLLTGETGSGKSLVVDALALLFGGRASADLVRTGADRARVGGIFQIKPEDPLTRLLEDAGVEVEDGELLIEREIAAGGKSRAFAGSRPATTALLRELGAWLGDIHGQHEQQKLFAPDSQLEMLDSFAGSGALLLETASLFRAWRQAGAELAELDRSEQERLRLADLWSFQRREIEDASPQPGEDASLEDQKRVLLNLARLQEHAGAAYDALYDAAGSALARLRHARRSLEEIRRIDPRLSPLSESLSGAEIAIEETAHELRHYLGGLEGDPSRLDEVEARLAALDRLKRKYGATIEEILRFHEEVSRNVAGAESASERRDALKQQLERLAQDFETAAARLTSLRARAAEALSSLLQAELKLVGMDGTRFRVDLGRAPWSERGADRVVFLVSPNPGEELRPLDKIASGGELSRIALSLKTCTAGEGQSGGSPVLNRTLVFDEVDAGVGGGVAEMIGRRLKQLAASHQVLCVTHLPQIAGFADHHFVVEKREADGRTVATVEELRGDARTREIGRMLSGQRLTKEALRHAEQLIRSAAEPLAKSHLG
ncbi:MAG: DNA repair protein RecN [Bryobacteraceae bacterium]|nr:DNA repair protein RecN [Bryobacteraceae bacterium]